MKWVPPTRLAIRVARRINSLGVLETMADVMLVRGIPEHIRDGLFDPFVSGKVGGKGLGLALAAKIVAEHDGVIEFESQPRRTVFAISLPLANEPPSPTLGTTPATRS